MLERSILPRSAQDFSGRHDISYRGRLDNGDLSVLDPLGVEHFAATQAGRGREITFFNGVRESNETLCAPLLRLAIEGSVEARLSYEATRGINISLLPTWGQGLLSRFVRTKLLAFEPCPPHVSLVESARRCLTQHRLQIVEDAMGQGPHNAFITLQSAKAFLELARGMPRPNPVVQFDPLSPQIGRKYFFNYRLCPSDTTAAGAYMVTVGEEAASLAFAIQMVSDLCSIHDFEVSEKLAERMVKLCKDRPWEFYGSPDFKRLLQLSNLVSDEPHIAEKDRRRWLDKLFNSTTPRELLHAARPSTLEVSASSPPAENSSLKTRGEFMAGVGEAIRLHAPSCNDPERAIRCLYALSVRGLCSFAEIIEKLRAGEDPTVLVHLIRQRSEKRVAESERGAPEGEPAEGMDREAVERELITAQSIKVCLAVVHGKTPFLTWLATLDTELKKIAEQRLERLANGNPGDCRRLSSHLSELRIHHGPGMRIYLWMSAPNEAVVVHGGIKDTQDNDIAISSERIAKIENLSPYKSVLQ